MDLVGPGPLEPHFLDAIESVRGLDASGTWADLGSGAGFPGVALAALHPSARVELVERRQRRAAFLHTVVADAGLRNVTVVESDAERLPPGSYAGLISRAFRAPEAVLPLAERLLSPDGRLVLLLSRDRPSPGAGWELESAREYDVEGHERRVETWRRARVPRETPG